ncbi:branched-chain amino acid ABC transporter permease [Bosea sp. F3-2]|uniref:branched-chain amino acid ABC transporter permease n=1 Tax=Bosea sp. F3-2 TaxID=2599640 RepID=UPI0011F081F8|nr:branched-chain amino acid ABC transporter permease [Bosea sp. F3-2]QEL22880.1 branched-chain amino acid ABC transporter permease [Bosea sp. F3-2]
METFLHQCVVGLSAGAIYASVALSLVMIYRSTHHVNFAQGEMAMFSTFVAWGFMQAGIPYWGAFALTVAVSFLIAGAIEFFVIRPLRDAPDLTTLVVFIGLLMIFHSLAGWIFGDTVKKFPSPFPPGAWYETSLFSAHEVGAIFVSLLLLAILYAFFRWTPLGLAMRAAAENRPSAELVGINVGKMLLLGWGLAGAIGAVAGMMIAPVVFLDPNMMIGVLLYSVAGALIGGIDSPGGAVAGGFLVGLIETLVGNYVVGTELRLAVALVLIVATLTIKPSGLFGRVVVKRV